MTWENTNRLLDKGYEGVKTGVTDTAGPCLSSSYRFKAGTPLEFNLIVVVLNCKNMDVRF